jgi:valyl-tRNA synthetase
LFHPFIPFVTEQIWQQICSPTNYPATAGPRPGGGESKRTTNLLMVENWPKAEKKLINKKAEQEFEKIKNLVIEIRNWKITEKTSFKEVCDYQFKKTDKSIKENQDLIEQLAKVKLRL